MLRRCWKHSHRFPHVLALLAEGNQSSASLLLFPWLAGRNSDLFVVPFRIVLRAIPLLYLPILMEVIQAWSEYPGRRVGLRINDGNLKFQRVCVRPREAFGQM